MTQRTANERGGQSVDSVFVVHDPCFEAVLGPDPQLLHVVATNAHEGPVYSPREDALYFTTLPGAALDQVSMRPRVTIRRLALDGARFPLEPDRITDVPVEARTPNGMCLDADGQLIVCEQGDLSHPARISRVNPTAGTTETLVDSWAGLRFNSPNDVVRKSDGTIWFTDPAYGYLQAFKGSPQIGDYVYRYDPSRDRVSVVADSFVKPNGLAFSPDEQVLYITDSGANQEPGSYYVGLPHHVIAFDVVGGSRLSGGRLFAVTTPGFPDGIKVDGCGRVYASSFSGVQVFDPSGELIGEILLPGAVNFTFAGADRNVLLITTDVAVWAAVLGARGPQLACPTTGGS